MERSGSFAFLIAIIIMLAGQVPSFTEKCESYHQADESSSLQYGTESRSMDDNLTLEFKDPVFDVKANQLSFPIDLTKVEGFWGIDYLCSINQTEKDYLSEHGYVNTGSSGHYDLLDLYDKISDHRYPAYITTDAILHVYHILFDQLLGDIEEEHLIDLMENFTGSALTEAVTMANACSGILNVSHDYVSNTPKGPVTYRIDETLDLKEIALKNVVYLSIALRLLDPSASTPSGIESRVKSELDLIDSHSKLAPSPLMDRSSVHEVLGYMEDYTQYVPRGHYTRSEQLENYFKAMMWMGRMTFRQKSAEETMQAILLTQAISNTKYSGHPASELWNTTYDITSFFVGWSDDLTYRDYQVLSSSIYGNVTPMNPRLKEPSRMVLFMDFLDELRKPRIDSHYYMAYAEGMENATMGMRVMGQRFVPDSYMMQQLVFPNVGSFIGNGTPFTLSDSDGASIRGFPRGMDVMAVLGNGMAESYLLRGGDTLYNDYESRFGNLKAEFDKTQNSTWGSNLYWGWLYTIRSLNENFTADQYPTFMRDNGYLAEKLNTVLGSWTELRHDTVLYTKQSHAQPSPGGEPKGYVEPIPIFYSRMRALTNATREGLDYLDVLGSTMDGNLKNFSIVLTRLESISVKELENKNLTDQDYDYIDHFHTKLATALIGVPKEAGDSRLIVDVHTDFNMDPLDGVSQKCLEEALGYFDLIVIVRNDTDGKLRASVGPIFSYYEFKEPISKRLNDDDWTTELATGNYEQFKFEWMDHPENMGSIVADVPPYSDISITSDDIHLSFHEMDQGGIEINAWIFARNLGKNKVDTDINVYLGSIDEAGLKAVHSVSLDPSDTAEISETWTIPDPTDRVQRVYVELISDPSSDMNPYNDIAMNFIDTAFNDDRDWDGIPDRLDDFPFDPAVSIDSDGDGYPDSWNPGMGPLDSTQGLSLDVFPNDPTEWRDTDGDGYGDNSDLFPNDPLEWEDTDSDGVGDNSDPFPEDPLEWADTDSDGFGENSDAFPDDPAASIDTDGDGFPDVWNAGKGPDHSTTGLSIDAFPEDPYEWLDTDGDGVGDNSDQFPNDPTEWKDTDDDGFGDNSDLFPTDPSEWADMDGDGSGDNSDIFPEDPLEWTDSDGDGWGDNSDQFPNDPSAWKDTDHDGFHDGVDIFPTDPFEWTDSDYDGVGDNGDAFPEDPAASIDSDGDGYPDNWNLGMTEKDSTTGLVLDKYPADPDRFKAGPKDESRGHLILIGSILALSTILSFGVVIVRSRSRNVSKRISRHKRNILQGIQKTDRMMNDDEIAIELERRRTQGTISKSTFNDLTSEFGPFTLFEE